MSVMPYAGTPTPNFEESSRHEWVSAGEDNLWFLYLESLMLGSGMHNAIVKGVADMIFGHGLDATNKDQHIDQWLKVKVLFGDETCLKRAAFDLKLYGQCYLNVIWSQDRTTISEVHHVPCANVRSGKVNDEDEVTHFYYSTDWEEIALGYSGQLNHYRDGIAAGSDGPIVSQWIHFAVGGGLVEVNFP